ncbi:sugar transferase [Allorhizobium sp. BGMRC 0089]|nr:sugar transferase [Allorhizobium sonneratiae]MCM2290995.1 sugar transferase [Allorhizobium sonneratiae]
MLKRAMDIVLAASTLVMLLPFLLAVAALIRLETPGPVLFRQTRWGKNQRKIRILKFRTMYSHSCDESGVRQTIPSDPRITAVGAVLRRSNIDELPQLFNVLRGDMSLIGPRCHAIGMLAGGIEYEQLVPDYHARHSMRPGLTGLAQMHGLRGPTHDAVTARARIDHDLLYIETFSIWLDLQILFGTIKSELMHGKGF